MLKHGLMSNQDNHPAIPKYQTEDMIGILIADSKIGLKYPRLMLLAVILYSALSHAIINYYNTLYASLLLFYF